MSRVEVTGLASGEVSEDGRSVELRLDAADGEHALVLPYEIVDQFVRLLPALSQGAYRRQIASGTMAAVTADPTMQDAPLCERARCGLLPSGEILLEALLQTNPTPALSSYRMPQDMAAHIGRSLLDLLQGAKQRSNLS